MGTVESSSKENANTLNRTESNQLLKRNSSSLHILQPKPAEGNTDFIQRKWRFKNKEDAENKYQKVLKKVISSQNLITVKNVEILESGKVGQNKRNPECYIVKAKIECPRGSLLQEMKFRKIKGIKFTERELINILISICESLQELERRHISYVPEHISEIFYVKNKIKLRDPELLPTLKTSSKSSSRQSYSKRLCILLICLGFMEEKEFVVFQDIIKFNLSFSTSLTALLFRMNEGPMRVEEILKNAKKIKGQSILQQANLKMFKNGFCMRKNSENILNQKNRDPFCPITEVKNNELVTDHKHYYKSASQSYLGPDRLLNTCQSQNIIRELFDSKQNIQASLEENLKTEQSDQQIKKQVKTSIEIEEHQFPKSIKPFRKSNPTASSVGKDSQIKELEDVKKQELHAAFIKLTNGTQINLHEKNQQLLESLGDEDQSILVKEDPSLSDSPVVNLKTQAEESHHNGYCEEQFEDIPEDPRVIQFQNQHNSTIMEVSEEDESCYQGSFLHENHQVRNSSDIDNFSDISKKSRNEQHEEGYSKLSISHDKENQNEEDKHFIVEEYEGGSRYEGYMKNGLKHGFGKLYYEDGGSYEGSWFQGEIQGFGKLYYQSGNLAYEGYWVKGEFNGEGKIINEFPARLDIECIYNNMEEIGASWEWYQGAFERDQKHGEGILMLEDGSKYIGNWVDNEINGDGKFVKRDGEVVRGRWQDNMLVEIYGDCPSN